VPIGHLVVVSCDGHGGLHEQHGCLEAGAWPDFWPHQLLHASQAENATVALALLLPVLLSDCHVTVPGPSAGPVSC
jgi:hypothetical protein